MQPALDDRGDLNLLATEQPSQRWNAGDFLHEANAPRAVDTAGHDSLDQGPEVLIGHHALVLVVAADITPKGHRLVLQVTLTALVANRAIEGMIDEQ